MNRSETPLRRINGAFIGIEVPAGDTHVELRYRPFTFYGSLFLSLVTFVLLVIVSMHGGSAGGITRMRVRE